MSEHLQLDGTVVIVRGAGGRGIGMAYAELLSLRCFRGVTR